MRPFCDRDSYEIYSHRGKAPQHVREIFRQLFRMQKRIVNGDLRITRFGGRFFAARFVDIYGDGFVDRHICKASCKM